MKVDLERKKERLEDMKMVMREEDVLTFEIPLQPQDLCMTLLGFVTFRYMSRKRKEARFEKPKKEGSN